MKNETYFPQTKREGRTVLRLQSSFHPNTSKKAFQRSEDLGNLLKLSTFFVIKYFRASLKNMTDDLFVADLDALVNMKWVLELYRVTLSYCIFTAQVTLLEKSEQLRTTPLHKKIIIYCVLSRS